MTPKLLLGWTMDMHFEFCNKIISSNHSKCTYTICE